MPNPKAIRFANASSQYYSARQELLAAEQQLRKQVETVAALRRALPPGQLAATDYQFTVLPPNADQPVQLRLADLFVRADASLIMYSFMYAEGAAPCPMCTAFLDSLNGAAQHLQQRINLAIVAKCSIAQLRQIRDQRSWQHLTLVSSENSSYNGDYWGELPDGQQLPMLNVFKQTDEGIRHHYATELFFTEPEPGQHSRHLDMAYPLWNLFDITPEGRPNDWFPQVAY